LKAHKITSNNKNSVGWNGGQVFNNRPIVAIADTHNVGFMLAAPTASRAGIKVWKVFSVWSLASGHNLNHMAALGFR
jgi:hypothetical protein